MTAQMAAAFFAGTASFFSPCVLPLLPGYISLISGVSADEISRSENVKSAQFKTVWASALFVLGFTAAFVALGAGAHGAGLFLVRNRRIIYAVSGIALVILGLHTAGVFNIRVFNYERRADFGKFKPGFFGAFFMGLAFALGWSPCIGPMLSGALMMAAAQETAAKSAMILAAYSAGLGAPFIAAGFMADRAAKIFSRYRNLARYVKITAGAMLILIGIIFILQIKLRGLAPL